MTLNMFLFVHDKILKKKKPQKNKQTAVIVNYALYKVEVQSGIKHTRTK